MARGVPVQPETRAFILKLIREEVPRNEIARRTGVSTATVSRIARAAGLSFDRAQTKQATSARSVDLAVVRVHLAEEMSQAAMELLRARKDKYLVYNFGGKDNTYAEHVLERPPVEVIRNAVTTAGIAFDKATKVLEKATTGTERAESLVDHLEQFFDRADNDSDE